MDCREARRILDASDPLRLSDGAVARALEHAERCDDCQHLLEQDRRLARWIGAHVPRVEAPAELRERVSSALARERAEFEPLRQRIAGRRLQAAALGLVLAASVASLALWIGREPSPRSPALAFTRDYLMAAVEQESLRTEDRDRMTAFFVRELGLPIRPPLVPGYALDRGLVCLMNDRRGAVIEYRVGDRWLSFYVIPRDASAGGGPSNGGHTNDGSMDEGSSDDLDIREIAGDARLSYGASGRDLAVATWNDPEHHHALVGNAGAERLRALVPVFECPRARA